MVGLQYTSVKLLQFLNAYSPFEVTLLPIVTLVKLLLLENAITPNTETYKIIGFELGVKRESWPLSNIFVIFAA